MHIDSANSQCYYHLVNVLLKAGTEQLVIACYRPELKFEEAEVYYGLEEVLPKAEMSLLNRFPVILVI